MKQLGSLMRPKYICCGAHLKRRFIGYEGLSFNCGTGVLPGAL